MSKSLWRKIIVGFIGLSTIFIVQFLIRINLTGNKGNHATAVSPAPSADDTGTVQPDMSAALEVPSPNIVTGEVDPIYGYEYGPSYDGGVTHTAPAEYPPELQAELEALTGIYTQDETKYKLPKTTGWITSGTYGRNVKANWLCGYRELMNFADVTDLEIDEIITPVITEYAIDVGGVETTMSIAPVTKYTRDEKDVIWFYGYVEGSKYDENGQFDEDINIKVLFHCGYDKSSAVVNLVPATREEIVALPEDTRYYYTEEEYYNHRNLAMIAIGDMPWGKYAFSAEEAAEIVNNLD